VRRPICGYVIIMLVEDASVERGRAEESGMSTFVLIPGAGGDSWYWHRVVPRLEAAGQTAIAVDLPGDDDTAGLAEYARLVIDAIGGRTDVRLVAQSLGGFTAPMVCEAVAVESLTFVNAMIPRPYETAGDWWDSTGAIEARAAAAAEGGYGDFDPVTYFLHDVPADIATEAGSRNRPEADAVFASKCDFTSWRSLPPVRAVAGSEDRFFPVEFQRRVAHDRLGIDIDVLPGGHLIALAQPGPLVSYLLEA
jgi:pimeloyl-ACP methyl ester carboxylesterase